MNQLPPGWAQVPLATVADVRLGRQRSPKNHTGERMRPYLRAANVTWSGLDLTDVKQMNFSESESQIYELRPGDVLVAEASGSASEVGKPALWRDEIASCCFQNTLVRVRTRGPLSEYLLNFLRLEAMAGRLGDASRGVGIHHIGAQRLQSWTMPVPPIPEQRRIVVAIEEHVSRLDAAEKSLRRARAMLRALQIAVLKDAINGPTQELGSLAFDLRYGTSIKCTYEPLGPPVLRIPNIQSGRIDTSDLKFARDPDVDLKAYLIGADDLLFVRTNGSRDLIGRVASAEEAPGMAFASYLIRARLDRAKLLPRYAVYALSMPSCRAAIEARAATSAGQYNLNLAALKSLEFPVPSVDDQRRIVARVEEQLSLIDALSQATDAALARSASLHRSILERAFTGMLVPQDPSDEPASALLKRIAEERATAPSKRSLHARMTA